MSAVSSIAVDFWSLILLFGALQGYFFAAILFFYKKGKNTSNKLLAFLLFIFSLHLTEYVVIATEFYRQIPHAIAATVPVIFLIGPVYYLYAVSLLVPDFHIDLKRALHFLPAILCYLLFLPFYAQSSAQKLAFLSDILENGYVIFPLDQFIILATSSVQMLIYFYLTFARLDTFESEFMQSESSTAILSLVWLKRISLGFSLYMVLFFVAYFQLFFLKAHQQEIFYAVVLILAVFIHTVAFHTIRYPEIFAKDRQRSPVQKYQKTALPAQLSQKYLEKLLHFMESEKPFLNPDLKLPEVAEALKILPNYLSQVINSQLDKNFFDFVNAYRIDEARQRLLDKKYAHFTILAIALDTGFNNKASFNRVFKKHTGMTPSEFVQANGSKIL